MPEGVRALEAVAKKFGFEVRQDWFDFASYDYYAKHDRMMPEDWKEKIGSHDAIFFGAVGWPAKIPDHISLWGSLILFRREFDQYVNLRPVRLMPGVPSPLANRKPGDIDFWVVRENTEGEYSAIGGRAFPGTDREVVVQETVFTRYGVDRVLKFAFELAQKTPKKHLTSATKSNGIAITMPYWDERVEAMAKNFPDVKWDKYHIDILSALFVLRPDRFNVVVASNLFGDILSDLGPACTGTIGIAPGGNINPERLFPSVFEPVHGSAPDIAGQGIANPIGQIWSAAMMLDHLGEPEAAAAIVKAIEQVLADPKTRTRDLGGSADTVAAGKAVAALLCVEINGRQVADRADQGARQTHLAARAAARRGRAVRRRAGSDAGGRGASRLRADRHHQCGRALPSPDPLHAHSGLPARAPAAGADRRQERVRILDARAVLRADRRHALLHARDEAGGRRQEPDVFAR